MSNSEPSTLESVSRTIRGYVPSSMSIPSVAPTPPTVSRPVSFGSFLTPTRAGRRVSNADDGQWKRRGSDASTGVSHAAWEENQPLQAGQAQDEEVFNLDEDVTSEDRSRTLRPAPATYPSTSRNESILTSAFGTIIDGNSARFVVCRVLVVAGTLLISPVI